MISVSGWDIIHFCRVESTTSSVKSERTCPISVDFYFHRVLPQTETINIPPCAASNTITVFLTNTYSEWVKLHMATERYNIKDAMSDFGPIWPNIFD